MNILFIDLDSLYDTRLGTLSACFSDDIVKSNVGEELVLRTVDKFKNVGFAEFKQKYATRDVITLKHALPSHMLFSYLINFVFSCVKKTVDTGKDDAPTICVNTYPYELKIEELSLIADLLRKATDDKALIEMVRMPLNDITPTYIKSKGVEVLVIYNGSEWLEMQAELIKEKPLSSRTLIIPMLFHAYPVDEKAVASIVNKHGKDPFRYVEELAAPLIKLEHYPASYFTAYALAEPVINQAVLKKA